MLYVCLLAPQPAPPPAYGYEANSGASEAAQSSSSSEDEDIDEDDEEAGVHFVFLTCINAVCLNTEEHPTSLHFNRMIYYQGECVQ